jgi:hypothetical protein
VRNNARTITLSTFGPGCSIDSTLERAINLLRSNNVVVLAAAPNLNGEAGDTATIVLAYLDDKPRAIRILLEAEVSIRN